MPRRYLLLRLERWPSPAREAGLTRVHSQLKRGGRTARCQTAGRLLNALQAFQRSQDFLGLAERTRADCVAKIKLIERKFGDFPLAALTDRRTRGVLMAWRDKLATTSRRQADYAWVVLARILSWALNRGLVAANPCEKGGRLYRAQRVDKVWTPEDEAAFIANAPKHLHLPLILALWTGQRQGDLLRLPWSGYDGTHIRLRQSKTGARVMIPVGMPLKAALDATPKRSTVILTSTDNKPWTEDGFRSSWRKACMRPSLLSARWLSSHSLTRCMHPGFSPFISPAWWSATNRHAHTIRSSFSSTP
jgi:integrase